MAKEKKEKETFAVKQNTSGHYVGGGITMLPCDSASSHSTAGVCGGEGFVER